MQQVINFLGRSACLSFFVTLLIVWPSGALAAEGEGVFISTALSVITHVTDALGAVLFYPLPVIQMPFLLAWLLAGSIFFTLKLGFVNVRLFKHALVVVSGKYSKPEDPGQVTHFQALAAAISATVGLGNIAGVAMAVTVGGPGAVIWMVLVGFLGMSTKFAEVTLGQKYRKFDENGKVSGGAFHYLEEGLKEKNRPLLGKILAIIFAICCMGGAIGGGNMFQSNQAVSILTQTFDPLKEQDWAIALFMSVSVGVVLIGGIRRIANVAEKIVPLMAFIYLSAAVVVLFVNADKLGEAFLIMIQSAIGYDAAAGGLLGAIIQGVQRASFSCEAGLGSAPIAHSAAKTTEPVRAGSVALLEPFIDTVVVCFMTGMVVVVTGVYNTAPEETTGILLTSQAFTTVISWFPIVLSVAVVLFAYSTMITWSYYGSRAWSYLFGQKSETIFHIFFVVMTYIGGVISLDLVINFSDLLMLSMAIPNLIGMYFLAGMVKKEMQSYERRLKAGEFKKNVKATKEI